MSLFITMTGLSKSRVRIHNSVLEITEGDIVRQDTDAIVNAANSSLMGGGGVDGAIHRAAGPELLKETRALGGCQTGDARITKGYRLRSKHVIHAVGPIYRHNDPTVADYLASAYRRSLELAVENNIKSIAFPAISAGIYGYPLEEAAEIAIGTAVDFLLHQNPLELVRFVLFTEDTLVCFLAALAQQVKTREHLAFLEIG